MKVLIFVDWFLPGYKAGGPITSCVNFVEHMKDDLDIFVFTSDRDLGDSVPYSDIQSDRWLDMGDHCVFYASTGFLSWGNILSLVKKLEPDLLYLNSMFSYYFTLYPIAMGALGRINSEIVISPRGMLRSSALSQKKIKKQVFLTILELSGTMRKIRFHATDMQERQDIQKRFGNTVKVKMIGNFPGNQTEYVPPPTKIVGDLKMIFVGRIHPIKNLHYLLSCLKEVSSNIELTVVGPVEDQEYWEKCLVVISELSRNVKVNHYSGLRHSEILEQVKLNHVFVLPTTGENFGHAIFESFACGRPVLISDQTPWKELEVVKAGWDIPLSKKHRFVSQMESLASMSMIDLEAWCIGAWTYCKVNLDDNSLRSEYLSLFGVGQDQNIGRGSIND